MEPVELAGRYGTMHRERAHKAWRRADRIKRLSDGLIGIGPFKLGVDGVLAWVPVAGTLYSVGAAALLINEALQAGASRGVLARMGGYLAIDGVSSGVPVLGWAVDTLFPGHAMAARALQRDIEKRHGAPDPAEPDLATRMRRAKPVGAKLAP